MAEWQKRLHPDELLASLDNLWRYYPALLYGLCLLIGMTAAFVGFGLLSPLFFFLFLPLLAAWPLGHRSLVGRLLLGLFVLVAGFFYVRWAAPPPLSEEVEVQQGEAMLAIEALVPDRYQGHYSYRGVLHSWHGEGQRYALATSAPVLVVARYPIAKEPSDLYGCYWLAKGSLSSSRWPWQWQLRLSRSSPPQPATWRRWSGWLCQWRDAMELRLHQFIDRRYISLRSRQLLSGLLLGRFDEGGLWRSFARFGLQHLLAISGFHFSLLAFFMGIALSLVIPSQKWRALCLLGSMSLYLLSLGASSSVLRAFCSLALASASPLIRRKSAALNSLGVGLLAVLLFQPFWIGSIGFQCTFLITAALLLFVDKADRLLQPLARARLFPALLEWHPVEQGVYLLASWLRQAIALALAVDLVAFPLLLFHFGFVPLLSSFYNLFFPALIAAALFAFAIALLVELAFPPLAPLLHGLNDYFVHYSVGLAADGPAYLDWDYQLTALAPWMLILYLTLLFGFGLFFLDRRYRDSIC